ncbi:MAG: hypothetical protein PHH54_01690 [Candidatus Nanoarchaeia archaeon]|nr:hypothetical protein [Candidatus Nanoarchaeia archaeon]MDD5740674.1 hypothetical protein [Candidatus Nanoarchaeia archaeon]
MECPYIPKNCKRLEKTNVDYQILSAQEKSAFERSPVETLKTGFCSTPDYINCAEFKKRSNSQYF